MNQKTSSIQSIMITLLLLIGFSSGALALPDPAISRPQQTTRFYVWASTGPLSYLTDARITIRDAKGKLVAMGKTNHRGIVGFRVRNKKLRELPLSIVTSGGKIDGMRFSSQLKARAHEVGGKTPIIHLNLISTAANQMAGQRGDYAEAVSKVRKALKINKGAAVDTLRVKNPYVDGDRLKHAVLLAGGYTRFVREIGGLAKLGQVINGLEPPQPTIKTRGQPVAARILKAALDPEQAAQKLEPVATTQSNTSTLCTTQTGGDGNTVTNYGSIATASLLEVVGLPLAATDGVTGMLLSSVGLDDSSPTTEALDNIAEELDCISSQLQYIEEELAEIKTQIDYDTLETELTDANNCQSDLATDWSYYSALANGGDPSVISSSNPNLCVSNGGACGSGDIYDWQTDVNACGAVINNTLFGNGGDAGGSAWAELNILYQSEYAWYTQAQVQAMQSWLSYWSTMIYYQFVLQNEVFNFYGQWLNAVTFSGGPGTNGSTACAYNQSIPNVNVCQWQSNIQYAYPTDLYSDEIGLWNGTAINAFPGGIAIGDAPQSLNDSWLAANYGKGGDSFSNPYDASTVTASAMTDFNNRGINPAGNPSAIETWDSPQALRTLTLTSSDVSSLGSPQTQASGALTASEFLFSAVNQIPNTWPTNSLSASNIGYYTSDNVSIISGKTYYFNGVPYTWYVTVATNSTIPSGTPTTDLTCEVEICNRTSGNETILAALMGRTWWPGASNATNSSFYNLLPVPLTVPNAPTLTALNPSDGEIAVAFIPVPASQDGGMTITGYVATCTAAGSTTPITASGTASPITVTGLTGGVNYNCTIQAENAGGLSAIPTRCPIASCSATPNNSTTPSAPVDLVATAGYLQISLAFNPPSDTGGQAITGYQANCTSSTAGATSGQASGTQSPLLVTGLTGGVEYSCTVVAQNINGSGPAASTQSTPLTPTAPGSPTITSTFYSYYSDSEPTTVVIGIFFDPPENNGGSDIINYNLTCISTNATPSITLTGVIYGASSTLVGASGSAGSYGYTYSCTVTATNQDGLTSSPSSAATLGPS